MNVTIHVEVHREEARRAVPRPLRRVAVVGVQRDAVHFVVALLQDLAIPGEIGRHEGAAGSTGNQLQVRIDDAHLLGGVARLPPVLARLQLADLPGSVHLVAEAPVADVVRPIVAVRSPELAPPRAPIEVAVLDVGDRRFDRAGAEVHAEQRLGAHQAAPLDELVGAELVRLDRVPGAIEHHGPLRFRTDAVEPVVAGDEIAARIANDRHAEILDLARDVGAESFPIGEPGSGLVDAGVDRPAEVLEERTEHAAVEIDTPRRSAQPRPRRAATALRVAERAQPRRRGERTHRPGRGSPGRNVDQMYHRCSRPARQPTWPGAAMLRTAASPNRSRSCVRYRLRGATCRSSDSMCPPSFVGSWSGMLNTTASTPMWPNA